MRRWGRTYTWSVSRKWSAASCSSCSRSSQRLITLQFPHFASAGGADSLSPSNGTFFTRHQMKVAFVAFDNQGQAFIIKAPSVSVFCSHIQIHTSLQITKWSIPKVGTAAERGTWARPRGVSTYWIFLHAGGGSPRVSTKLPGPLGGNRNYKCINITEM